ncbi:MAG: GEVED domain-containing protein, partial [Verrucomicrobia bacterium]|nr:GEVED domain-containing protein [Verrucomicrobiota bacterium]
MRLFPLRLDAPACRLPAARFVVSLWVGLVVLGLSSVSAQAQTLDFSDFTSFGSASSTRLTTLRIGATTDAESAITANAAATGDDITGSDDEDGVTLPADIIQGALTSMTVNVTNTSGSSTYLNVWIDYNRNGSLADAGELVLTNSLIANGTSNVNRAVTFTVPLTATTGVAGVRVRLTSTSSPGPTGASGNGEVEDYVVNIVTSTDFGDYPSFTSASQRADSALIRIGTAETDTEAANPATGLATVDDTTGTDDEDLTMPVFTVGATTTLSVPITATTSSLSGTTARAIVFVDWNGDNDVLDANETLAVQTIANGTNTLSFSLTPPTGTGPGTKYLRIRVSETTATPTFSGASTLRGEVEDYAVTVLPEMDFGDWNGSGA